MKKVSESQSARAIEPAAVPEPESPRGFLADLREIVMPSNKWYYAFHMVVIGVALAYWIGSLIVLPKASWAEIVMYRPGGDNQVWPVVTALSHFNFGDPTDALNYGKGIGGFHAVILLPHAMAYAIFGPAGYMIADAVFSWCSFVTFAILLGRWGLGRLSGALLSTALSTGSLQVVLQKVSDAFAKFLGLFRHGISEWDFPDLINLSLGGKRLPRPFPTEILLVLILYFLVRHWQERRAPTLRQGLIIGVLMGLLMQGDPYSFSTAGLLILVVLAKTMWIQKWRFPWRFSVGGFVGAAVVGSYFVVQMLAQNPDGAVRFGLAPYPRSRIMMLPGYAPWLRLMLVACMAIVIAVLVRSRRARLKSASAARPARHAGSAASPADLAANTSLAMFALAMVACGWLAQPVQLLLLGKGAEIYHYFLYTMPAFYSFGILLVMIRLFKVLNDCREPEVEIRSGWSRTGTGVLCGGLLVIMFLFGVEDATDVIRYSGVSRRDASPWAAFGDNYRPSLRALDKEFRENPALKNSRTFATFCQEVNFLLTAFQEKRAYLPDNAYTTLDDKTLERRLFEFSKICQIRPDSFSNMIQDWYTMNFWLGCAKYWCATDYRFGPDDEYPPQYLESIGTRPEAPFNLVLPKSEFDRLTANYGAVLAETSDASDYPDVVIQSLILKEHGITIDHTLYRETYTNSVFTVYTRIARQ